MDKQMCKTGVCVRFCCEGFFFNVTVIPPGLPSAPPPRFWQRADWSIYRTHLGHRRWVCNAGGMVGRAKSKYSKKILSQHHSTHKSHMECPGAETVSPQKEKNV
jgi:hypothetical protein